jgi:phage-related protein (TIGR01555 family)
VRLIGLDYPDEEMGPDPWGDSCLQPVHRAIRRADIVDASVAQMISEAKVDVIKVKDLSEHLATDAGTNELRTRWQNANTVKSVVNALLLNLDEEFETRQLQLSGLQEVMNVFMLLVAGGALEYTDQGGFAAAAGRAGELMACNGHLGAL